MIIKGWTAKLYPTKAQAKTLSLWCNHARGLWNVLLGLEKEQYQKDKKFIWGYSLQNLIPALKKENPWIGELPAHSSQVISADLTKALKKQKKGKGFPKFKKKRWGEGSVYLVAASTKFIGNKVKIPKMVDPIKFKGGKLLEGRLLGSRIVRDGNGFRISSMFECEKPVAKEPKVKRVALDVGLKDLAVVFDGQQFEHANTPKFFRKSERLLKRSQRRLSARVKGSNRRLVQLKKVHAVHKRVKNQRKNFLHQLSHKLITKAGEIKMETLNIRGMVQNHHLAKSISDAGMGELTRQLKYKANWYGRTFTQVDPWFASSQLCSRCGDQNKEMKNLSRRTFYCGSCGLTIDRDENAAVNLFWYGEEPRNPRHKPGTDVETGNQDSGLAQESVPVMEASIVSHLVELPSA
jgi:putative transposase